MWDLVDAILTGLATGLSSTDRRSRSSPKSPADGGADASDAPSFAGEVVTALVFALLAVGAVLLALITDGWGGKLAAMGLAVFSAFLAVFLFRAAVDDRRKQRAKRPGFPVIQPKASPPKAGKHS